MASQLIICFWFYACSGSWGHMTLPSHPVLPSHLPLSAPDSFVWLRSYSTIEPIQPQKTKSIHWKQCYTCAVVTNLRPPPLPHNLGISHQATPTHCIPTTLFFFWPRQEPLEFELTVIDRRGLTCVLPVEVDTKGWGSGSRLVDAGNPPPPSQKKRNINGKDGGRGFLESFMYGRGA